LYANATGNSKRQTGDEHSTWTCVLEPGLPERQQCPECAATVPGCTRAAGLDIGRDFMSEGGVGGRSVVVVGGGYAGITVAKALDEVAAVTLVDPRNAFVNNVASLRALVEPGWLPRMFYPYERLLSRGRAVQARATQVEPGRVVLDSGETLPADYVVLATGSTYPFPAKPDVADAGGATTRYQAAHEALAASRRVLLLGAGPVGIELAGEILARWPDKQVTILETADDILQGPFKPELRQELRRQLADGKVELLLSTTLRGQPEIDPGIAQPFMVSTTTGRTIAADIWFRCYGVAPVSDYLAGELAAARTPDGFIEVMPDLRVKGQKRVFAIGDVATIDAKMAGRAHKQAEVAAANIRALIDGQSTLTDYVPFPPVILVPFGPEGGASQLPGSDGIAGADVTANIKGRTLFSDRYAEMFNGTVKQP
jgi:apoptosis-inducing factor 2